MTTSENIQVLESYKNGFTGQAGDFQSVIDEVVDTLERYQKIEAIVKDRFGKVTWKVLDAIIKVVNNEVHEY